MNTSDKFLISIIELDAPIESIVSDCVKIVDQFKRDEGAQTDLSLPYSIVLTRNPGTDETKGELVAYSEIHNQKYFDRNNSAVLNEKYSNTSLPALISALPFPFSIIRLSILPPHTIITMHTDAACHAQLAITTNEDCFVAARTGETKHVPVDGQLYVISTTLPHTAFNASEKERIHLSISIFDDDYVGMLRGKKY